MSCCVSPQQVGTGNPNIGLSQPSGIGAGVECSFANFAARDKPDPAAEEERAERLRKSVARNAPAPSESLPFA